MQFCTFINNVLQVLYYRYCITGTVLQVLYYRYCIIQLICVMLTHDCLAQSLDGEPRAYDTKHIHATERDNTNHSTIATYIHSELEGGGEVGLG